MTTTASSRPSWGRDVGWTVVIVLGLFYGLSAAAAVAFNAVRGDWFAAVLSAVWLPFSYWVAVGAWRRTRWGAAR